MTITAATLKQSIKIWLGEICIDICAYCHKHTITLFQKRCQRCRLQPGALWKGYLELLGVSYIQQLSGVGRSIMHCCSPWCWIWLKPTFLHRHFFFPPTSFSLAKVGIIQNHYDQYISVHFYLFSTQFDLQWYSSYARYANPSGKHFPPVFVKADKSFQGISNMQSWKSKFFVSS